MPVDPNKETIVYQLPWAWMLAGMNELKLRAKTIAEGGHGADDAVGWRFQVPRENLQGSGWLMALFADIMDGTTERVQFKLGIVMDVPPGGGAPSPYLVAYATDPNGQGDGDDGDEKLLLKIGLNEAYIRGMAAGEGSAVNPSRIYFEALPNGTVPFVEIRQRDGHVTLHRIADENGDAIPESSWGDNTVVWSNWHGRLKALPWAHPGWNI